LHLKPIHEPFYASFLIFFPGFPQEGPSLVNL
jgi:hypothetical protein